MTRPSAIALCLPLAGCAGAVPDGIWLFHLDPAVEETCETSITHNFLNAWSPEEEQGVDPWTETETLTESEAIFMGLVTSTGRDTAVLVVGDATYLGTAGSDGAWTFTWTGTSASSSEEAHASGYHFNAASTLTDTETWDLALDAEDRLTGDMAWSSTASQTWAESDTWSKEVVGTIGKTGQMPVGTWLVTTDGAGGTTVASNGWQSLDCATGECALDVAESCSSSTSVDGERTDLDADEAWEGVQDAGQTAGSSSS